MKENSIRKEYKSIDFFKFIFAIFVVAIHCKPFLDVSQTVNWWVSNSIFNLAVPFFFITSGFLLFDKLKFINDLQEKRLAIKKYALHILKLYLVWSLIWLPLKILGYISQGGIHFSNIIEYLQTLLLSGSTGDALWYLLALLVCIVLSSVITKNGQKGFKLLFFVATLFYVLGVLISSWYKIFNDNVIINLYYKVFLTTQNGLFEGLIFFTLGAWLATHTTKVSIKKSLTFFIIGLILLIAEVFLVYRLKMNKEGVCNLLLLPFVSMSLFFTIFNIKFSARNETCHKLRDYSTLIYVSHGFIIRILNILLAILNIELSYTGLFIIVLLLALTFAIFIRITKNKNCKVFRVLY